MAPSNVQSLLEEADAERTPSIVMATGKTKRSLESAAPIQSNILENSVSARAIDFDISTVVMSLAASFKPFPLCLLIRYSFRARINTTFFAVSGDQYALSKML